MSATGFPDPPVMIHHPRTQKPYIYVDRRNDLLFYRCVNHLCGSTIHVRFTADGIEVLGEEGEHTLHDPLEPASPHSDSDDDEFPHPRAPPPIGPFSPGHFPILVSSLNPRTPIRPPQPAFHSTQQLHSAAVRSYGELNRILAMLHTFAADPREAGISRASWSELTALASSSNRLLQAIASAMSTRPGMSPVRVPSALRTPNDGDVIMLDDDDDDPPVPHSPHVPQAVGVGGLPPPSAPPIRDIFAAFSKLIKATVVLENERFLVFPTLPPGVSPFLHCVLADRSEIVRVPIFPTLNLCDCLGRFLQRDQPVVECKLQLGEEIGEDVFVVRQRDSARRLRREHQPVPEQKRRIHDWIWSESRGMIWYKATFPVTMGVKGVRVDSDPARPMCDITLKILIRRCDVTPAQFAHLASPVAPEFLVRAFLRTVRGTVLLKGITAAPRNLRILGCEKSARNRDRHITLALGFSLGMGSRGEEYELEIRWHPYGPNYFFVRPPHLVVTSRNSGSRTIAGV